MQLQRIEDPRSKLNRARRKELAQYAEQHGITEIKPDMPAIVMRKILISKDIREIPIPNRVLGMPQQATQQNSALPESTVEMDAEEALAREWMSKPVDQMNIRELRTECKARGIKMERTDNIASLRAKLNG